MLFVYFTWHIRIKAYFRPGPRQRRPKWVEDRQIQNAVQALTKSDIMISYGKEESWPSLLYEI